MADIKEVGGAIGGTSVIDDNKASALHLQSADGQPYVTLVTTDSGEKIHLKQNTTIKSNDSGTDVDIFRIDNEADAVLCKINAVNTNAGEFVLYRGGATGIELDASNGSVFNEPGLGVDFRVESDNDTHILFVDGSADKVALGRGLVKYFQGTGSDTTTTQAVYLADTNATLIIDFANGNFGDVTLAANVTNVKFLNTPVDGTVATVTARITQDSSTRTIDYSDSAVTVYAGDGTGSAATGEIKFSGDVHHTQSTGSGDVDIISFTSIPTGSTFNIYAAVIGQDFA